MIRLPRRAALALPALLLPGTAQAEGWPVLRQGGIVLRPGTLTVAGRIRP